MYKRQGFSIAAEVSQSSCFVKLRSVCANRNDHANSLFEHLPANINNAKKDDPNYCQCDKGVTVPARITCTAMANTPRALHVSSVLCCFDV